MKRTPPAWVRVIGPGAVTIAAVVALVCAAAAMFFIGLKVLDPGPGDPSWAEVVAGVVCVLPIAGVVVAAVWSGAALVRWLSILPLASWLMKPSGADRSALLAATSRAFVADIWLVVPLGLCLGLLPLFEDDPTGLLPGVALLAWLPSVLISSLVEARGAARVGGRSAWQVGVALGAARFGVAAAVVLVLGCVLAVLTGGFAVIGELFWPVLQGLVEGLLWLAGMD